MPRFLPFPLCSVCQVQRKQVEYGPVGKHGCRAFFFFFFFGLVAIVDRVFVAMVWPATRSHPDLFATGLAGTPTEVNLKLAQV